LPRLTSPKVDPRKVFEARDAARLTQEQLARKMRCSFPAVQKWESGDRNPGPRMLKRLADATGKTEEFFYAEVAA
jgi:transcriptional regulator with XRE-family HTH domain